MAFGRLERTTGEPPMSDINMTPLIDVMLVLLVIFMVTAPLLAASLKLELPRAAGATAGTGGAIVTVTLDAQGQIDLEGRRLTLEQLGPALAPQARRQPVPRVHLRADATVPYGQVLAVMGVLQQAGLSQIGFATAAPGIAPSDPVGQTQP